VWAGLNKKQSQPTGNSCHSDMSRHELVGEREQPEDALARRQEFQPLLVWARQKPSLKFGVTLLYFIRLMQHQYSRGYEI